MKLESFVTFQAKRFSRRAFQALLLISLSDAVPRIGWHTRGCEAGEGPFVCTHGTSYGDSAYASWCPRSGLSSVPDATLKIGIILSPLHDERTEETSHVTGIKVCPRYRTFFEKTVMSHEENCRCINISRFIDVPATYLSHSVCRPWAEIIYTLTGASNVECYLYRNSYLIGWAK